jgi:acyl carrier protein
MDDTSRAFVLSLLAEWSDSPPGGVQPQHRLVQDLRLDGDDFGTTVVRKLNQHFGIKPKRQEWETIVTVADLLALLDRHLERPGASPGAASA